MTPEAFCKISERIREEIASQDWSTDLHTMAEEWLQALEAAQQELVLPKQSGPPTATGWWWCKWRGMEYPVRQFFNSAEQYAGCIEWHAGPLREPPAFVDEEDLRCGGFWEYWQSLELHDDDDPDRLRVIGKWVVERESTHKIWKDAQASERRLQSQAQKGKES